MKELMIQQFRLCDGLLMEYYRSTTKLSAWTFSRVLEALRQQRASLKHPPLMSLEFIDMLERQHLPATAAELRYYADSI
jgi:hypothetical protein